MAKTVWTDEEHTAFIEDGFEEAGELMKVSIPKDVGSDKGIQNLVNILSDLQHRLRDVILLEARVDRRLRPIRTKINHDKEQLKMLVGVNMNEDKYVGLSPVAHKQAIIEADMHQDRKKIQELERQKDDLDALDRFSSRAKGFIEEALLSARREVDLVSLQYRNS